MALVSLKDAAASIDDLRAYVRLALRDAPTTEAKGRLKEIGFRVENLAWIVLRLQTQNAPGR